jgi:hypothetical protein
MPYLHTVPLEAVARDRMSWFEGSLRDLREPAGRPV